jgi:hypothetical protein
LIEHFKIDLHRLAGKIAFQMQHAFLWVEPWRFGDLGAKTAHVEIQIVDKVDRIGSGAKLKSVVAAQT